jgi:hypothetical protein
MSLLHFIINKEVTQMKSYSSLFLNIGDTDPQYTVRPAHEDYPGEHYVWIDTDGGKVHLQMNTAKLARFAELLADYVHLLQIAELQAEPVEINALCDKLAATA